MNEKTPELIYFELNTWEYPEKEPFEKWLRCDRQEYLLNDKWVKENKLCVYCSIIDQSVNFNITALKPWIEQNCPSILTEDHNLMAEQDEFGEYEGTFGTIFLEYKPENIGITWEEDKMFKKHKG